MRLGILFTVFVFSFVLLTPSGALANHSNNLDDDNNDGYYDGNKLEPDYTEAKSTILQICKTICIH